MRLSLGNGLSIIRVLWRLFRVLTSPLISDAGYVVQTRTLPPLQFSSVGRFALI
jgi:hypothetical protein